MKSSRKKKKEVNEFKLNAIVKQVKKFRDFKEDTLEHFGLMYVKEAEIEKKSGGTFTLCERLAIPIYSDGVQIGISFRKLRAQDTPKWFHTPPTIVTGDLLYNYDACKKHDIIIVCEGMFDVWKWHEAGFKNAVCTYGAHLTDEQYKLLIKSGKDIVWSYDNDEAGNVAKKKAIIMMRYKVNQYEINIPEGKDPGSCEIDELKKLYENKEKIYEF